MANKNQTLLATADEAFLIRLHGIINKECEIFVRQNKDKIGEAEIGPMTSEVFAKLRGIGRGKTPAYYKTAAKNRICTYAHDNFGWLTRRERLKKEEKEAAEREAIARGEKKCEREKAFKMPVADNGTAMYSYLVPALKGAKGLLSAEQEIDATRLELLAPCSSLYGHSEVEAEEARRIVRDIISTIPESIQNAMADILEGKPLCETAMYWTDKKRTTALKVLAAYGKRLKKVVEARLGVPLSDLGFRR